MIEHKCLRQDEFDNIKDKFNTITSDTKTMKIELKEDIKKIDDKISTMITSIADIKEYFTKIYNDHIIEAQKTYATKEEVKQIEKELRELQTAQAVWIGKIAVIGTIAGFIVNYIV
jgi:hypothetical protein